MTAAKRAEYEVATQKIALESPKAPSDTYMWTPKKQAPHHSMITRMCRTPDGFELLRHQITKLLHWPADGEIAICPERTKPENVARANYGTGQIWQSCVNIARASLGIEDAEEWARGKCIETPYADDIFEPNFDDP